MLPKINLSELEKINGIGKKTLQEVRKYLINKGDIEKKSIEEVGFPNEEFDVIYADPPWKYGSKHYQDGNREFKKLDDYYSQMNISELKQLPVNKISKDNSLLFMWVTDSHIKEGIEVMNAWGFDYKTIAFNWIKHYESGKRCVNFSPYTLKSWEICLLGTKGKTGDIMVSNNVQGYVNAVRTKHSKKPQQVVNKINELVGDKNKIELFARRKLEGWTVWGNEV